VGHVEHPGPGADRVMLGQDPGRVLHRHLPSGEGNHLGPQLLVGVIQGSTLQL
jgi:hypothetical protein